MKISSFFNDTSLNTNFTDLLTQYDSDQNGFTRKELQTAISGITNIFARNIVKLTNYDNKIFGKLDIDKNKIISYDELAKYAEKEYNLDFYSFINMTLKEVCDAIDEAEKNKKEN